MTKMMIEKLKGTKKNENMMIPVLLNPKVRKEIKEEESVHTKEIQRSKYLKIDGDIMNPMKCNMNMKKDQESIAQPGTTGYAI